MAHCISRCRPHTYTLLPLFCITAPPVFLLLLLFPSIDPIIERVRFSWLFFFLIIKHICKSVKTLSSANGETHTARFQKLSCQTSHQDFCKFVTSQLNSDHLQPHPQHGYGCKKKKKTGRADVKTWWLVPSQAWKSWPMRADWDFFRKGALKRQALKRSIQTEDE